MNTAVRRQTRPHCICTVVCNYDYDQAAEKLRCKKRFLQDRISLLPHQKLGESVAFCDCDLRVVQSMFTVVPDEIWERLLNPQPDQAPVSAPPSLHSIKPAGARRPSAAAVR
ncbi:hypothetical protein DI272_19275 [Streptomyces sp. Act143]|uniref:hypothetical protein n=1 Tax=Streptomyces sp. Act143 TaxID=2200760 RepID=UPI000D672349|nr:hypothetical protein [Streptomyces sp. Act143]PWI16072.1 hypothetical protein DI272_19275 [Streptomyces sp. Act143]